MLYNFGKFWCTYGNYSGAVDYLYHFRMLSTDVDLNTSAHLGKLVSDILTGKWDVAQHASRDARHTSGRRVALRHRRAR